MDISYLVESVLSSVAWFTAGVLSMHAYCEHQSQRRHSHDHRKGPRR